MVPSMVPWRHVAAPLRQDRIEVTAALEHRLSSEEIAQMKTEW